MRSLLLLFALPALAVPVPEAGPGGKPMPGGVADPAGKVGFVTGADGDLDALDLATGKKLWSSNLATKAVAADGKRVVALAGKGNALAVVSLDAADGKKLAESQALKLPDWVVVRLGVVTADGGKSFAVTTHLDQGDLLVRWAAGSQYWGGARPTPEIEAAARKNADGYARFDLASGKVVAVGKDAWPGLPKLPAEVEKQVVGKRFALIGNGSLVAAVEVADKKVVLRRWTLADKKALEPIPLLELAGPTARVEIADGKALVHKAAGLDATWHVFDLESGKAAGKIDGAGVGAEVGVVGDRGFAVVPTPNLPRPGQPFATPRTLQAFDLATGKALWEHPLEPERRSPPPP